MMMNTFKNTRRLATTLLISCSALALGQEAALSDLLDQLKSPNVGVRGKAAMSIAEFKGSTKAAVPGLAVALADRNLNVRYFAASALKKLGPDAKAAVPALIAALKTFPGGSPELEGPPRYYPDIRSLAAEALGAIGPAAKEAIPALKEAMGDKSPDVAGAAAAAIKKVEAK